MAETPHLRAVEQEEARPPHPSPLPGAARRRPSWVLLALGAALIASLGLLAWSRVESERRVTALEARVTGLEVQIQSRDRLIEAQGERLSQVRSRLDGLRTLLDEPLPEP